MPNDVMYQAGLLNGTGGIEETQYSFADQLDFMNGKSNPDNVESVAKHTEKQTNWESIKAAMSESMIQEGASPSTIDTNTLVKRFLEFKEQSGRDPNFDMLHGYIASLRAGNDTKGINELLQSYVNNLDPKRAADLAKNLGPITKDIQTQATRSTAADEAFIDHVKPDLDNLVRENFLVRQKFAELADKVESDMGWGETITNYAGLLLPFGVSKDLGDLAGTRNPLTAVSALRKMATAWETYDPETKLKMIEPFYLEILKATDNNKKKALMILGTFMEPGAADKITTDFLMDVGFGAFDFATLLHALRAGSAGARSLTKVLGEAGDTKGAANINAKILQEHSGKVGEAVGTPSEVAHGNALPFDMSKLDSTRYLDQLHGDTMNNLRDFEAQIKKILDPNNPLLADSLYKNEIEALRQRYVTQWNVREGEAATGISKIDIVDSDNLKTSYSLTFGRTDNATPFPTKKAAQARMKDLLDDGIITNGTVEKLADNQWVVKSNDLLHYTEEGAMEYAGKGTVGPLRRWASSPSMYMAELEGVETGMSSAVNAATRALLGKDVLLEDFKKAINAATKPLGNLYVNPAARARMRRVDQVLLQGDAWVGEVNGLTVRGKVYSPQELRAGVTLPDGSMVHLNDAEQQAYYSVRRVVDMSYVLKNEATRRALVFRGMRNATIAGDNVIAKPFLNERAARAALDGSGVNQMWNPKFGKYGEHMKRGDIDIKEMYDEGYQLVRTERPVTIKGEDYTYAWVKKQDIGDLPEFVTHYKPGYIPKIHKDAFYFLKEAKYGKLNGVAGKQKGTFTHRIFDSLRQAQQYLKRVKDSRNLIGKLLATDNDAEAAAIHVQLAELGMDQNAVREAAEAMLRGELDATGADLFVVADRQLAQEELDREALGLTGGLYDSPRAKHDIFFGVGNEVPQRYSAFESVQRYISHVSNYFPRNNWRIAEQERWMKTAKLEKVVPPETVNFRNAVEQLTAKPGAGSKESLKAAGNYILDMSRVPTAEEQWFSQMTKNLAEWVETPKWYLAGHGGPQWVQRNLLRLSKTDPVAFARAMTFHALLGWLRPDQLFVQAQGASVAMSLHPEHWMKSMHKSTGLMAVMYAEADSVYTRAVAKALGMKETEMVAMKKLWDKTGLYQSVLSTADHAASIQGYGITRQAMRNMADKGLFFYRNGELFSRSYSFATALEEFTKKNPGRTIESITDKELKDIIDYTMHISLNMMRSNRAAFQRGLASLPTQFMQVQTKWYEALLSIGHNKFDRSMRMKALAMQALIYGASGIPLGHAIYNAAVEFYSPDGRGSMPKELTKYLNGGIWDVALYSLFAADNDIGVRGAMADGLDKTLLNVVYGDSQISSMLGPAGKTGSAVIDAITGVWPLVANADKVDFNEREYIFIANKIGKLAASWKNVTKAMIMSNEGRLRTSRGGVIVAPPGGFNPSTIIAQALGFNTTEARETMDLTKINKADEQMVQDIAQTIIDLHFDYLGVDTHSESDMKNMQALMSWMRDRVGDPRVFDKALRVVENRIMAKDDMKTKAIRQYYENHSVEAASKSYGRMVDDRLLGILRPNEKQD